MMIYIGIVLWKLNKARFETKMWTRVARARQVRFILLGASICDAYTHGRRGYGVYKYVYLNLRTEYIYYFGKGGRWGWEIQEFCRSCVIFGSPFCSYPSKSKAGISNERGECNWGPQRAADRSQIAATHCQVRSGCICTAVIAAVVLPRPFVKISSRPSCKINWFVNLTKGSICITANSALLQLLSHPECASE